jgi:hypothetical protein
LTTTSSPNGSILHVSVASVNSDCTTRVIATE